jgi:GntR family transcriptional regulator / MocR family aminotransferase
MVTPYVRPGSPLRSSVVEDPGTRQTAAELLLTLDRRSRVPLRAQLEHGLRELIRTGALTAGAVLPSSRTLAGDLAVSRRLVVEAYEQLIAEGYLEAGERSGTRVANVDAATTSVVPEQPRAARYNLHPGIPSLAHFPRTAWAKAIAAALRDAPDAALAYPDPRGAPVLRAALAEYLRRVRAVPADPERIVICSGFREALSLLVQTLRGPTVAVEEPGMIGRAETIVSAGGTALPVPVDDAGMRVDLLAASAAQAVVVAPAHQFPLGVTLSPRRRAALLAWARSGGLVIEDDYDAEFRYDRQPIGALHGLASENVVYIGTCSKTLAPALRLGWMVLPSPLIGALTEAKHNHDSGSPTIDQLALAHMISTGAYERHLRRLRREYRQRRDRLVAALRQHLPEAQIAGTAAGLHLMLNLPNSLNAAEIAAAAGQRDLDVTPVERYMVSAATGATSSLVIGYGNIATSAVPAAVTELTGAIADTRRLA